MSGFGKGTAGSPESEAPRWRDRLRAIEGLAASWDWTIAPWFLDSKHSRLFEFWGLSNDDLIAAQAGLKRLYPPEYCRGLFDDAKTAVAACLDSVGDKFPDGLADEAEVVLGQVEIVQPLYCPTVLLPPLHVATRGIDADLVRPDQGNSDLVERLRHPFEVAGADLELEVWGSLLRAGWRVCRFVPPPEEASQKGHDLLVGGRHGEFLVEIKDLRTPDDESAAWDLEVRATAELLSATAALPEHLHVEVSLSQDVAAMNLAKNERPKMARMFRRALCGLLEIMKDLEANQWPLGERVRSGAGALRVRERTDDDGGPFSSNLLARQDARFHASRMLNPIKSAAKKARRSLPGVAFVDIPPNLDHDLAAQIAEDAFESEPERYRNLDAVIVRSSKLRFEPTPGTAWITWHHCFPQCRISREILQSLAEAIIRCSRRQPARYSV